MPGLAADENLNNDIVRGLWRRKPDLEAEWEGQVRYLPLR